MKSATPILMEIFNKRPQFWNVNELTHTDIYTLTLPQFEQLADYAIMPKFSQNLDCAHIKINEMIFTVWYETMAAYCIVYNTYRQLFDCCKVRDYAFSCCYCWVHCNSYYCCCCKPNYNNVAARRRLNAPAQGNWRHKILVHLYLNTHTPVNVTAIKLYVLLTALRALNAIYLIGNAGIIILQRAASACVALNA